MSSLDRLLICVLVATAGGSGTSAAWPPLIHRLDARAQPDARLNSNAVIDLVVHGDSLWLGTGSGLNQVHLTTGAWASVTERDGLGRGGVSAIAVTDTLLWAATAFTEDTDFGPKPAGGGIGFSRDGGTTWTWLPQPVDSPRTTSDPSGYTPTTTHIQNVIYDIALSDSAVWIVCYGGGLRRLTWENFRRGRYEWDNVPPDDLDFSAYRNLNHRGFSAAYSSGRLWVGTAAGVNRSDDEGLTWGHFQHITGSRTTITGNFVTALAVQRGSDGEVVWAATWKAEGATEYYGVCASSDGLNWQVMLSDSSVSTDGGQTWRMLPVGTSLPAGGRYLGDEFGNLKVHNFAFDGAVVYAAADDALWRSDDRGGTWVVWAGPSDIYDPALGERLMDVDYYSVAAVGDTLWVGTSDGLARGWYDRGAGHYTWRIHRAYRPAGVAGEPATYAYPNPFSPVRGHLTRIQVRAEGATIISLGVYNWAMERVLERAALVLPGAGAGDMAGYGALTWDGRDDSGRVVANGVYFYKVVVNGKSHWGKIMVLD